LTASVVVGSGLGNLVIAVGRGSCLPLRRFAFSASPLVYPDFAVPLSIPPHVASLIKLVRSGHRTGARAVH
jgi:hypothetical protein